MKKTTLRGKIFAEEIHAEEIFAESIFATLPENHKVKFRELILIATYCKNKLRKIFLKWSNHKNKFLQKNSFSSIFQKF